MTDRAESNALWAEEILAMLQGLDMRRNGDSHGGGDDRAVLGDEDPVVKHATTDPFEDEINNSTRHSPQSNSQPGDKVGGALQVGSSEGVSSADTSPMRVGVKRRQSNIGPDLGNIKRARHINAHLGASRDTEAPPFMPLGPSVTTSSNMQHVDITSSNASKAAPVSVSPEHQQQSHGLDVPTVSYDALTSNLGASTSTSTLRSFESIFAGMFDASTSDVNTSSHALNSAEVTAAHNLFANLGAFDTNTTAAPGSMSTFDSQWPALGQSGNYSHIARNESHLSIAAPASGNLPLDMSDPITSSANWVPSTASFNAPAMSLDATVAAEQPHRLNAYLSMKRTDEVSTSVNANPVINQNATLEALLHMIHKIVPSNAEGPTNNVFPGVINALLNQNAPSSGSSLNGSHMNSPTTDASQNHSAYPSANSSLPPQCVSGAAAADTGFQEGKRRTTDPESDFTQLLDSEARSATDDYNGTVALITEWIESGGFPTTTTAVPIPAAVTDVGSPARTLTSDLTACTTPSPAPSAGSEKNAQKTTKAPHVRNEDKVFVLKKPTSTQKLLDSSDPEQQRIVEAKRSNYRRLKDADVITCLWVAEGQVRPCHTKFQGTTAFLEHCVAEHGVSNNKADKDPTICMWVECDKRDMQKGGLRRHLAQDALHGRRKRDYNRVESGI